MKLRKNGLFVILMVGVFGGSGAPAQAQWSGSFTDLGVVYTLSDTTVGSSNTHSYILTVNTNGYSGPSGAYLDSVNVKAWGGNSGPKNVLTFAFAAPLGSSFWSTSEGPINNSASGCGGGTSGFACLEAATKGVFAVGPTYQFEFNVTAADAADFLTSNIGPHVGAGFADSSGAGQRYGITSVTMIPEPEIYAMLLAGLGLMGFVVNRRRQ